LRECGEALPSRGIVFAEPHQHRNASHALALLRSHNERPRQSADLPVERWR
jgi:hypothetical protein